MTNQDILRIAMEQTAIDSTCKVEDLLSKQNVVVISKPNENARRYLNLPSFCDLVSYGSNIVASVDERIADFILQYKAGPHARLGGTVKCSPVPGGLGGVSFFHWQLLKI